MIKTVSKHLTLLVEIGLIAALISLSGCAGLFAPNQPAINAEYGDAPDQLASQYPSGITAKFPSRFSSDGARHLDTTDSALGSLRADGSLSSSAEFDATDLLDPDGVQNLDEPTGESDRDAMDDGLMSTVLAPGTMNNMDFVVSVSSTANNMTRYVNILADWNKDGEWRGKDSNGADEWIVKNMAVNVTPGTSQVLTSPDFLAGVETNPVWVRITLSDSPIDASAFPEGWDGTGEFTYGETEDYFLEHTEVINLPDENLKIGGGPLPPFPPPFPPIPGGGGGGNGCNFYHARNSTICEGSSTNFLALIGGFKPDSVTASSDNPNVASVFVNEANVTINGITEGSTTVRVTVRDGRCFYNVTIFVKVKKCNSRKPRIDCCSPAQIKKDPGRCKNCKKVGWTVHTNETPGGGAGGTRLTDSFGNTSTSVSKSYVVTVYGNVIKIVTVYYECDPCPCGEMAATEGDKDGDKIPDEIDSNPYACYNPENPHYFEDQLLVDSYFDVDFEVNNSHDIFDERYFEYSEDEWLPEDFPTYYPYPEGYTGPNGGEFVQVDPPVLVIPAGTAGN